MVAIPTGPEDRRHEGRNHRPIREFDAHRLIGLICRYPKHKWHFKVWQFMWIKMHVQKCYECSDRMDALLAKAPKTIGPTQEKN